MRSSRSDTKPDRRFVLHVPQLESLLREAGRLPPLIDALVRRSRPERLDETGPQSELVTGVSLPAAPLTRRLDRPGDAQGAWLRADPVGLVPDLAAVWLDASRVFAAGEWSTRVSELLAEEGLSFELTDTGRGYIRLDAEPDCRFVPRWALAGTSLEHCQPRGRDARRWRRLLNETQVLLQQHRRSVGDSTSIPGSLWFWGGGALPERSSVIPRVDRIVADDPVLAGLAEWLAIPHESFDAHEDVPGGTLLEWPPRFELSADANLEALNDFLRTAWRRLRRGRIRELELASLETRRRFTSGDAWRVWR